MAVHIHVVALGDPCVSLWGMEGGMAGQGALCKVRNNLTDRWHNEVYVFVKTLRLLGERGREGGWPIKGSLLVSCGEIPGRTYGSYG